MKNYMKSLRSALLFSIGMIILCGVIYPLALTAVSQLIFPVEANASLIEVNGKVVGSAIVGQEFSDERLFKCRISAYNYNTYTEEDKENGSYQGVASGSNNYANSNPKLKERMKKDLNEFLEANPEIKKNEIPVDLLTASASGLDPHISIDAAMVQVPTIAKASGLSKDQLTKIVEKNTTNKILGVFGEDYVNVLKCNLDVAKLIGLI
ncbi:MAG: potassium-transporting ATPase subunit KdpC [Erysipelotrichaceae bacterium]